MTPEKILEVIERYRRNFTRMATGKTEYPHDKLLDREAHALEHCHAMLDKMVGFVKEGRIEKACRWLGFIQGVYWRSRIVSLDDLKDTNRPSEAKQ